jgi:isopentenyl-diphosphate Delta-isomerase
MADELIEEWDWETGLPTGRAVSRQLAHRKGIPHEGVHLWIVSYINENPYLLLQRRAPHKEFYPGKLDITVGGHVLFGQTESKVGKEAFEELGIHPSSEDLVDLGFFRYDEKIPELNLYHREYQHIWLMFGDRSLDDYKFHDGEVDALAAVPFEQFTGILNGSESCSALVYDGDDVSEKTIIRDEFHPLFFTGPMVTYMRYLVKQISLRLPSDQKE